MIYDSLKISDTEAMSGQYKIFQKVWPQAAQMRESGDFLAIGKKIECPVIAIQGDYDPHPYQGVQEPLSRVIRDFTFILLNQCGHEPWNERHASEYFFQLIEGYLKE